MENSVKKRVFLKWLGNGWATIKKKKRKLLIYKGLRFYSADNRTRTYTLKHSTTQKTTTFINTTIAGKNINKIYQYRRFKIKITNRSK
jgi:hypothetical protein